MRLLLQEHIYMMKEEVELEGLVEKLITSMGHVVVSLPQKGVKQNGVDIHSVGIDHEDGVIKNFLITIKKGNITRSVWDGNEQAVRSSLNEIIDNYIKNRISEDYKKHPIKIIVCCGGALKQEVQESWVSFSESNSSSNVAFKLWNGSELSLLVEDFLLTEDVFAEEIKQKMRRTLVVLSDYDYDLAHYKQIFDDIFLKDTWKDIKDIVLEKKAVKTLATIPICLGLIYEYSKEAGNLKHPLIASEFALLRCWDFICKNKLEKNVKVNKAYAAILILHIKYCSEYFLKIQSYCQLPDGLTLNCRNSISASEVVFEQIGIMGTFGISQLLLSIHTKADENFQNAKAIAETLKNLIINNSVSCSPYFDENTIDIFIAINFLYLLGEEKFIKKWFFKIVQRFSFSYVIMGRSFPIGFDSFEKFIEFEKEKIHSKEEMSLTSTLLAHIAYWCVILKYEDLYTEIVNFIEKDFSHCNVQIWYPAKGIKDHIYSSDSAADFGVTDVPIHLPKTLDELRDRFKTFFDFIKTQDGFETNWNYDPPGLPYVASRHFRTPLIPFLWLKEAYIFNSNESG